MTGGTGFIGSHLYRTLRQQGHEVLKLTRSDVGGGVERVADVGRLPCLSTQSSDKSDIHQDTGPCTAAPYPVSRAADAFEAGLRGGC